MPDARFSPDLVGRPDILLVWPQERAAPEAPPPRGFDCVPLDAEDDAAWIELHEAAVPSFTRRDLTAWLHRYRELALSDGILMAIDEGDGLPVATAGSIANDKDGMFPGGGQLAWVATRPEVRRRGLATWLSALATRRLLAEGYRRVFVCTGDDLPSAIRIYLGLGFRPCLYASDQRGRWESIVAKLGADPDPDGWPTLARYLRSTAS